MAGFKVVVVACDEHGNISLADLHAKVSEHQHYLARLMITYPSTYGVYEASFRDKCDLIHQHGGQVYLDGANFNALVGLSRSGKISADVAHLNLHKTFCIPHGGDPRVGPISMCAHLSPFLPDHPVVEGVNPAKTVHGTIGTVSAAPRSSGSLYTISWAYIDMMGAAGLRRATLMAILNANYIAKRLFCDALIAIRQEITAIQSGEVDAENNLLHNALHHHCLLLEEWTFPYSRQQAFFPDNNQHDDKYWPPVGRIDNVYGDRHVVCT